MVCLFLTAPPTDHTGRMRCDYLFIVAVTHSVCVCVCVCGFWVRAAVHTAQRGPDLHKTS